MDAKMMKMLGGFRLLAKKRRPVQQHQNQYYMDVNSGWRRMEAFDKVGKEGSWTGYK